MGADMTSAKSSCFVCRESLASGDAAHCGECGNGYHLNQTQGPGKDCGEVWINEEHMGLEFACNTCLHPDAPAANLDDILDAEEAAAVAGLALDAMIAAAESGRVRHRKTSRGVYLFERRDLAALREG